MTRLLGDDGGIVAEWTLLTNLLDDEVSAYEIALWYYWRWRIESYFKLLNSHGQEPQPTSGLAIARRILVAWMVCVIVWSLQRDDSPGSLADEANLDSLKRPTNESWRRIDHLSTPGQR